MHSYQMTAISLFATLLILENMLCFGPLVDNPTLSAQDLGYWPCLWCKPHLSWTCSIKPPQPFKNHGNLLSGGQFKLSGRFPIYPVFFEFISCKTVEKMTSPLQFMICHLLPFFDSRFMTSPCNLATKTGKTIAEASPSRIRKSMPRWHRGCFRIAPNLQFWATELFRWKNDQNPPTNAAQKLT